MTRTLLVALLFVVVSPHLASAGEDPPGVYTRFEVWATADGFLPRTITVTQGDRVQLLIHRTSEDGAPRYFSLGDFFVWERLETGRPTLQRFVATQAGEFTIDGRDGVHTAKFIVKPDR